MITHNTGNGFIDKEWLDNEWIPFTNELIDIFKTLFDVQHFGRYWIGVRRLDLK